MRLGFFKFILIGFDGLGKISTALEIEDSSIYSENITLIFLSLKLIDLSWGITFIISGGVSSLGPPEGDCIAAQDKK